MDKMEKSRDVFSDDSGFSKESRHISIENLEDCATQDACDFQDHFDNDSSNSSTEDSEEREPRHKNGSRKLRLNLTHRLNDFGTSTVLSPISDLAVNVAKTKISPTNCSHQTVNDQDVVNQDESKNSCEIWRKCENDDLKYPRTPTSFAFASSLKRAENISRKDDATDSRLITNALTINSNGMSSRGRRLDIAPLNFDDSSNSPVKMSSEEMSLYSGNTPQGSPRPCSISSCLEMGLLSPLRENEIIEERHDFDFNSMDSGFSNNGCKIFTFVQPNALPPKPSPPKNVRTSPKSISCFRSYNSLSSDSMESMDDDCMDLLDMESMDDNAQLPTSFNSIISGNIKSTTTSTSITQTTTPVFRRCLSMTDGNVNRGPCTPDSLKTIPEMESKCNGIIKTFKRPEPPTIGSPIQSKRYKQSGEDKENSNELPITRPVLRKSMSMNDDLIMNALSRSSSEPHLIGDFSRPFCLPLTFEGRHSDLKSISVHTMAELLRGEYKESVASFKVIDCRYPYEFEGGHIRGAQNLYTQDLILTELVNSKTDTPKLVSDEPMRNIIVFHCEFSSERGPKLSRFLRNNDRSRNEHVYPALHYPEIYLLHGGYKDFFEKYPELCDPINYRQMLDPNFSSDYRQFRAKSKSWNGDQKTAGRSTNRLVKTKSRNLIY